MTFISTFFMSAFFNGDKQSKVKIAIPLQQEQYKIQDMILIF